MLFGIGNLTSEIQKADL